MKLKNGSVLRLQRVDYRIIKHRLPFPVSLLIALHRLVRVAA